MSEKVDCMFVLFFDCSQDNCLERGQAGSGRSNDNLESVKKRFKTYMTDTMPIINHYRDLGKLRQIDANKSPESVFSVVDATFIEAQSHSKCQNMKTQ